VDKKLGYNVSLPIKDKSVDVLSHHVSDGNY